MESRDIFILTNQMALLDPGLGGRIRHCQFPTFNRSVFVEQGLEIAEPVNIALLPSRENFIGQGFRGGLRQRGSGRRQAEHQ